MGVFCERFVSHCVLFFLFDFEGKMWDLIVLDPDYSFSYLTNSEPSFLGKSKKYYIGHLEKHYNPGLQYILDISR